METLDFVRRELTSPEGPLYASLDADSEGHEGIFYTWTPDEVKAVLGPENGALFCATYGIAPSGNFEGKSIPNLLGGPLADDAMVAKLAPMKAKLLAARGKRVRPATDDKVLTAWNGLMISAFAKAYDAFGREDDLKSARAAADFVLGHLVKGDRLLVSFRSGKAHLNAYLDDYAFLGRGLVDLYESGFDRRDLDRGAAIRAHRSSPASPTDTEASISPPTTTRRSSRARAARTTTRSPPARPSPRRLSCVWRCTWTTRRFVRPAWRRWRRSRPMADRVPPAFASLLNASAYADRKDVVEIAVAGPRDAAGTRALLAAARARYVPARVIGWFDPAAGASDLPLLKGKTLSAGSPRPTSAATTRAMRR